MKLVNLTPTQGYTALGLLASCSLFAVPANAAVIVLDFEGLEDSETIENFYDGGTGGNGSGPGPDYDITFSPNSLALIDEDAGGGGNFGGEPSPDTIAFFLSGGAATMNVANGFDTGFSFFYSAINQPGIINVYDGLNATGNILATLNLPVTSSDGGDPNGDFSPFVPLGVSFSGIAKSVDFGGVVNQIGFDDITLGSATPGQAVPEPSSVLGLMGMMLFGANYKRQSRKQLAKK